MDDDKYDDHDDDKDDDHDNRDDDDLVRCEAGESVTTEELACRTGTKEGRHLLWDNNCQHNCDDCADNCDNCHHSCDNCADYCNDCAGGDH